MAVVFQRNNMLIYLPLKDIWVVSVLDIMQKAIMNINVLIFVWMFLQYFYLFLSSVSFIQVLIKGQVLNWTLLDFTFHINTPTSVIPYLFTDFEYFS